MHGVAAPVMLHTPSPKSRPPLPRSEIISPRSCPLRTTRATIRCNFARCAGSASIRTRGDDVRPVATLLGQVERGRAPLAAPAVEDDLLSLLGLVEAVNACKVACSVSGVSWW